MQAWRRTFHESFSYVTFASTAVGPEGVTTGEPDKAWVLFVGGGKTWRPRDWKVYPWMEAGIDLGTSAYRSDPPDGGEDLRFAGLGGALGADVRMVPWQGHKLNLAAGPLIGGHVHAILGERGASYGWDVGGRVRGLWEKKAGKAPQLLGELRVYQRTDVAVKAAYAQVMAGVGLGNVVLLGLYSGRASAGDCPQDADMGDCAPFSSTWGIGLRMYSDRE